MKYELKRKSSQALIEAKMYSALVAKGFYANLNYKVLSRWYTKDYDRLDVVLHDNVDIYCIIVCVENKKPEFCDFIDPNKPNNTKIQRFALHGIPIFYVNRESKINDAVEMIYSKYKGKIGKNKTVTTVNGGETIESDVVHPSLLALLDGNL